MTQIVTADKNFKFQLNATQAAAATSVASSAPVQDGTFTPGMRFDWIDRIVSNNWLGEYVVNPGGLGFNVTPLAWYKRSALILVLSKAIDITCKTVPDFETITPCRLFSDVTANGGIVYQRHILPVSVRAEAFWNIKFVPNMTEPVPAVYKIYSFELVPSVNYTGFNPLL